MTGRATVHAKAVREVASRRRRRREHVVRATSYDCPPTAVSNITGAGLKIRLDLTSESAALPFALPCDPPLAALDCACSVCTLDNSRSCNSDAECAAAGAGSCRTTVSTAGAPRMPNACDGQACGADLDPSAAPGAGVCTVGPTDTFATGSSLPTATATFLAASTGTARQSCPGRKLLAPEATSLLPRSDAWRPVSPAPKVPSWLRRSAQRRRPLVSATRLRTARSRPRSTRRRSHRLLPRAERDDGVRARRIELQLAGVRERGEFDTLRLPRARR